jgi:putative redox protein
MVKMDMKYEGDLHVVIKHLPSGTTLQTDAPVDNRGKGQSFSPTDLVATALGSCMATTMGIVAQDRKIDITEMELHIEKIMSKDAPRRIRTLNVVVIFPHPLLEDQEDLMKQTALHCPVALSIHPDIELNAEFRTKK